MSHMGRVGASMGVYGMCAPSRLCANCPSPRGNSKLDSPSHPSDVSILPRLLFGHLPDGVIQREEDGLQKEGAGLAARFEGREDALAFVFLFVVIIVIPLLPASLTLSLLSVRLSRLSLLSPFRLSMDSVPLPLPLLLGLRRLPAALGGFVEYIRFDDIMCEIPRLPHRDLEIDSAYAEWAVVWWEAHRACAWDWDGCLVVVRDVAGWMVYVEQTGRVVCLSVCGPVSAFHLDGWMDGWMDERMRGCPTLFFFSRFFLSFLCHRANRPFQKGKKDRNGTRVHSLFHVRLVARTERGRGGRSLSIQRCSLLHLMDRG